jgi:uncharacterized protein (TIGR02246 family)
MNAKDAVKHDQSQIRSLSQAWIDATRTKDISRLLSMIVEDAVFLPPGSPPVKGRAEIASMFRTFFSQCDAEQTVTLEEVEISGDLAFCWGAETLKATRVSGGPPRFMRGHGLSILRRQPDGSWKFARGINNLALVTPSGGAPVQPDSGH